MTSKCNCGVETEGLLKVMSRRQCDIATLLLQNRAISDDLE